MSFKLFLTLCLINFCLCWYEDCGSKNGSVINVSISDCTPEDKRCILKKKHNVTITITFTNVESKVVSAEVCGSLSAFPSVCIPFPLSDNNGCNAGIKCPIKPNQTNTYNASIYVQPSFPKVAVTVRWILKDENEKDIICLSIPANIDTR